MTDITSSKSKMQNEEVRNDAAVSQATQTRFGANTNYLIDKSDTNAADIVTNAGDISTNASNISTNASNISTNAGDITALENGFSSVATYVPTVTQSATGSTSEVAYSGTAISTLTMRYIKQHGNMYWIQLLVEQIQFVTSFPNHYFTLPATPDTGVMISTGTPFGLYANINDNISLWDGIGAITTPTITNGKIRIKADEFSVAAGSTYNIGLNMMFKST